MTHGTDFRPYGPSPGAPSAPPFSPADLANLYGWYDASDPSTITHVGGNVSQWADKSGNARHAVQSAGARQPQTGVDTMNGLNVLKFVRANNKRLQLSSYSTFANANNTLVVIFKTGIPHADQRVVCGINSGISNRYGISLNFTVADRLSAINNSAATVAQTPNVWDTNVHIAGMVRNGATVQSWLDRVAGASAAATNITLSIGLIFGDNGNGSASFDGNIAEIIFYSRALTSDELVQIHDYAGAKWGTP